MKKSNKIFNCHNLMSLFILDFLVSAMLLKVPNLKLKAVGAAGLLISPFLCLGAVIAQESENDAERKEELKRKFAASMQHKQVQSK